MKVEDNKIVEATEDELFDIYLKRGFDELFSFTDYVRACRRNGTHVIREDEESSE